MVTVTGSMFNVSSTAVLRLTNDLLHLQATATPVSTSSHVNDHCVDVMPPFPSNSDCLEGKKENYQVCSVQYCVQQLCTVNCAHI